MLKIPQCQLPEEFSTSDFMNEEFVTISDCDFLIVDMQYPKLGMKNAEEKCLLRSSVAKRLYIAASYLPNNYKLKIYDAWRPISLQKELYSTYKEKIINDFGLQNCSDQEKNNII